MKTRNGLLLLIFIAAATFAACGGGGGGGGNGGGVTSTPTSTSTPTPSQPTTPAQTWVGTLITSPTTPPITAFTQNVGSDYTDPTSQFNEIFPGHANVWTLDKDFTLVDGFDSQFVSALLLTVGSPTTSVDFPWDQDYAELTFYTPVMGVAEGVTVAAVSDGATTKASIRLYSENPSMPVPLTGTYSAFLNATSDSRLQQTLDLTSATNPIIMNWTEAVLLNSPLIDGYVPSYRVVVRNLNGTELGELGTADPNIVVSRLCQADLSAYQGQTIVLSFELRGVTGRNTQVYAIIDDVSVKDNNGAGSERVTNGNFETGSLSGWTTNTPAEVQNVTSGKRNVDGIDVRRSFYTVPNKLWGRWMDVFENNTAADIAKTITYTTSLGGGDRIIYYTPGTNNKAVTSWDFSSEDGARDIGWVFGNATSVNFKSGGPIISSGTITVTFLAANQTITRDPGGSFITDGFLVGNIITTESTTNFGPFTIVSVTPLVITVSETVVDEASVTGAVSTRPGNPTITVTYDITVPAGGRVALVNFILMSGTNTGLGVVVPRDVNNKATKIDNDAAEIVGNFQTDDQYRTGMTQVQFNAIKNY